MRHPRIAFAAVLTFIVTSNVGVTAAPADFSGSGDVPIAGNRARVSDLPKKRQTQIVSYDEAIDVMTADPSVVGAKLDLFSATAGSSYEVDLPAAQWSRSPSGRYRLTTAGDPKIKVIVGNGRLVLIALRGTNGYPLGITQDSIAVTLAIGTTRFCMLFGGTITKDDGTRFVARNAPRPGACPDLTQCPYDGPAIIDPFSLPDCSPACGGAHCVTASIVPNSDQTLFDACDASGGGAGLCAPDPVIEAAGNFVPQNCTSMAGAEGRCLSTCLPLVGARADVLPAEGCASGELCAPCYDPLAANPEAATGACSLACDSPHQPPTILTCPWEGPPVISSSSLDACSPACAGAHCVRKSLVPESQESLFASCDGGAGICAPDGVITTGNNFVPSSCVSIAGAEGRCLSTCLPFVAAEADRFPTGTCASNERCVPCYDPLAADPEAPTGACSLAGCDSPNDPPTILSCPWTGPDVIDLSSLAACSPACDGAHCASKSLVPDSQQSLFTSCDSGAGICAPDGLIRTANYYVPTSCVSTGGVEGRCMSTCLPSIEAQADVFPVATCASNERCAPCYNPDATPTGTCSFGCDEPQQPPPG